MVKKFMEKKKSKPKADFVVPADVTSFIAHAHAHDFNKKKTNNISVIRGGGGAGFGGLHKKLFGTNETDRKNNNKAKPALTEVKPINARTLAMVLTSERELLTQNKDLEIQITQLNLMLHHKNTEVPTYYLSLISIILFYFC